MYTYLYVYIYTRFMHKQILISLMYMHIYILYTFLWCSQEELSQDQTRNSRASPKAISSGSPTFETPSSRDRGCPLNTVVPVKELNSPLFGYKAMQDMYMYMYIYTKNMVYELCIGLGLEVQGIYSSTYKPITTRLALLRGLISGLKLQLWSQ